MHYYKSGEALQAKHEQTQLVSGRSFEEWALRLVPVHAASTILDAGCGWGRFTWPLLQEHGVDPSRLVCSDLSPGMLQTAAQEGARWGQFPHFVAADVEALPFGAGVFDGVMANHMLYHPPDIGRAVQELARVLKGNGWLLATTNSDEVYVPILDFHSRALIQLGIAHSPEGPSPFSMESGKRYLELWFRRVERFIFEDEIVYKDVNAFLELYKSTGRYRNTVARDDLPDATQQQLLDVVQGFAREMAEQEGRVWSQVRMGAFVCTGPRVGASQNGVTVQKTHSNNA